MKTKNPSLVGGVLRSLRVGYGVNQEAASIRLNVHVSYVSHVERGTRRPNPLFVRSWITAYPVPLMRIKSATADVLGLLDPEPAGPRDLTDGHPQNDMIVGHLVSLQSEADVAFVRRCGHALRLPAADAYSADDLPPLIWMALRSLRPKAASSDQVLAVVNGLTMGFQWGSATEQYEAAFVRDHFLVPLFDAVCDLPVLAQSADPLSADDPLWVELTDLWPRLSPVARRGLVAAAREWSR